MMELIFVRHALPVRGDAGVVEMADPVLSPLGERQSERLVNALQGQPFSEVVCSPAVRAVQTARPILQDRRLHPRIEPDLLEYCRLGRAYLPVHELRLEGGAEWEEISRGELPSFVDGDAFRRRVVAVVEDIIAAHPGRHSVLVVCHAGVINAYLGDVLGIERGMAFPIDYVSISRVFAGRDGRRIVHTVNEIQHVQDLLDVKGGP